MSFLVLCSSCVSLAGCIFGYYAPAPDGYGGDLVIGEGGATLESCDIAIWSESKPGTCIFPGRCDCGVFLPPGTPVRVLHEFVYEVEDVSLRVGTGSDAKVVHTREWDRMKKILKRPGNESWR